MWLKKIRRRKMQHFIIACILMISTTILLACISFVLETRKFVDEYYGYDRCPIYFDMVSDKQCIDIIKNDENMMKLLARVESGDARYVQEEFFKGDQKLNNDSILVYALDDVAEFGYSLPMVEGENVTHPADNEIWVCRVFADAVELSVGDKFTIGGRKGDEYTVSAIVDTPECSSGFIDTYPCYVNSETISTMKGAKAYGVRMYGISADISLKEYNEALPGEYKSKVISSIDSDNLEFCLSILAGIFGGVGVVAAILILSVSIVVIRYFVRSVIDKEYHMIGIYQAIGKSDGEIRKIYFLSYMLAGIIGIGVGLLVGRPLAVYLAKEIICGMKGFRLTYITNLISLFVTLFMAALLAVNIWCELKSINKITTVQALVVGARSTKTKVRRSVIKNAHSATAMAINNIFRKRGMSLLIILVLTVSYYTCLLAGAVGLSLSNYAADKNIWENLPSYDGYIKIINNEKVLDYLAESACVEDYVEIDLSASNYSMSFKDCDITKNEANPMVYSGFTEERYRDVPFTKGRICMNPYEITVSEQFLDKVDKAVGDYITIEVEGKRADFLIVGSYSAMMRGGVSFYLQESDLIELGVEPDMLTVLFFLDKNTGYEEFEKDFKEHFDDSKIYKDFKFIEQEGKTVIDIAYPICMVLFIAFAAFGILNIVNVVYTQNRENRKKYGILKAMGFTTGYICRQSLMQLTLESSVAIILTVILHEFLSPVLFSLACGVCYIYKPVWLTVAVCSGMYVAIMLITTIMLLPVRRITPVELMEE